VIRWTPTLEFHGSMTLLMNAFAFLLKGAFRINERVSYRNRFGQVHFE
jgi:hypothetical protein